MSYRVLAPQYVGLRIPAKSRLERVVRLLAESRRNHFRQQTDRANLKSDDNQHKTSKHYWAHVQASASEITDEEIDLRQRAQHEQYEGDAAEEMQLAVPPVLDKIAQAEGTVVVIDSVKYWRDKRDSLLTIRAEVSNSVEVSGNMSARKTKPAVLSDLVKSGYINADSALALAWYKIGLFTSDSTERKEAIMFLKKYVQREKADSALIREYLEELKK